MKYLLVGDFNYEELERMRELFTKRFDERERNPDEWPKVLYGGHFLLAELSKKTKNLRVISILEAESDEQLVNQIFSMAPERDFQFIPMMDITKAMKMFG